MNVPAQIDAQPSSRFDYAQLDADVAAEAQAAAERFRRRSETYLMDTGRDLLAVKARLEHGLFLRWVEAEMGLTPRTAQNFMQTADRLGHKSEIVSHLPPTTLYRLAAPSTPDHVRAEVLELAERERVEPKRVDNMVAEARAAAKEAAKARSGGGNPRDPAAEKKQMSRQKSAQARRNEELRRNREKWQEQNERARDLTTKAAEMIAERFANDLADLASLIKECDPRLLRDLVLAAALSIESGGQL